MNKSWFREAVEIFSTPLRPQLSRTHDRQGHFLEANVRSGEALSSRTYNREVKDS